MSVQRHVSVQKVVCVRADGMCLSPSICKSICRYAGQFHVGGGASSPETETVDHPAHYGGGNNPYEVIKVLSAWGLLNSFCLGNTIKYIARHEHKSAALEDLKKARWYLDEEIRQRERLT